MGGSSGEISCPGLLDDWFGMVWFVCGLGGSLREGHRAVHDTHTTKATQPILVFQRTRYVARPGPVALGRVRQELPLRADPAEKGLACLLVILVYVLVLLSFLVGWLVGWFVGCGRSWVGRQGAHMHHPPTARHGIDILRSVGLFLMGPGGEVRTPSAKTRQVWFFQRTYLGVGLWLFVDCVCSQMGRQRSAIRCPLPPKPTPNHTQMPIFIPWRRAGNGT